MSTVPEQGTFSIGEILSDSFSIFSKNFVPFAILTAILVVVPGIILNQLIYSAATTGNLTLVSAVGGIISAVLGYILQAAIVYGTFQTMLGQQVTLGEIVNRGLAVILPVIGVAILVGIGIGIGFLLLFIPGLILMTMWAVAIPVAVIERPGVTASISRSMALTQGNRWKIFALFVIYGVATLVVGLIFGGAALAGGAAGGNIVMTVVEMIFTGLLQMFLAVAVAVLYSALRNIKDGVGVSEIARVFD